MAKSEEYSGGKESRRLCIRLKVPPKGGGDSCGGGGGGGGSEKVMSEDLILAEGVSCGNRFESVKEEQRESPEEVGSLRSTKLPWSSLDDEKPLECYVCLKRFPSPKSLYGHMRLHPDRGWRGVEPPTEEVNIERVIDSPRGVVPGWSRTGKRGRKNAESFVSGLNSASMMSDGSSTSESTEVGKDVLFPTSMSNNKSASASLNLPNDDNSFPRGDKETGSSSGTKVETEIPPEQIPLDNLHVKEEKASGRTSCAGPEDKKPKWAMKRKAKEIDGTNPGHHAKRAAGKNRGSASATNYTCSTCQKSFPTFWALGGHKSSCNKTRKSATAQAKEATRARNSARDPQAAEANKPGTCSQNPQLDLSLSLSLSLSTYTTPGSSTIDDDNAGCNPTTDVNIPASEEDAEDNEWKMIKFL